MKKSGPETRKLSKKGEAMKWGVYVIKDDEGPTLSLETEGRQKREFERDLSFLKRSMEIPWLVMWKKPHSLQANKRDERDDGSKGWDCPMSKTGSSIEVWDSGIIPIKENEIWLVFQLDWGVSTAKYIGREHYIHMHTQMRMHTYLHYMIQWFFITHASKVPDLTFFRV